MNVEDVRHQGKALSPPAHYSNGWYTERCESENEAQPWLYIIHE